MVSLMKDSNDDLLNVKVIVLSFHTDAHVSSNLAIYKTFNKVPISKWNKSNNLIREIKHLLSTVFVVFIFNFSHHDIDF
jgi:flagellar biosynthesis protein FliR